MFTTVRITHENLIATREPKRGNNDGYVTIWRRNILIFYIHQLKFNTILIDVGSYMYRLFYVKIKCVPDDLEAFLCVVFI